MKALILLTVVSCALAFGPSAAYAGIVPTGWGTWSGSGASTDFNLTRTGVEWQAGWKANDNKTTAGATSGGSWYDIEALYLDIVDINTPTLGTRRYLQWLLVNSYAGVEYLEWTQQPGYNGTTHNQSFSAGTGAYAQIRDGLWSSYYPYDGPRPWAYRSNPVIGIDLNADKSLEYALVLDDSEACNNKTQWGGTPYDITTYAALYSVPATNWVTPPEAEYGGPPENILAADVDTRGYGAPGSGASVIRERGTDTNIAAGLGTAGNSSTKQLATDIADAAFPGWCGDMPNNWYWSGSMDITGVAAFDSYRIEPGANIHYSLWCGNDSVDQVRGNGPDLNPPTRADTTPELSSGALLLVGMLPVGLGWLRRRKAA